MRYGFVCGLLAAIPAAVASAASFPPITDTERALTQAPGFPHAPAVVLFEKAELRIMEIGQDNSSSLDVHRRIKILAEEGKEFGEVEIWHSRDFRLSGLEGRTVLPDGREIPLPKDSVFEERTSRARKSFRTKAAFPAIEVGAIIDLSYTLYWDSIYHLEPWFFHNRIPTLLAEITYDKPDNLGIGTWHRETSAQKLQSDLRKTTRGVRLRVWLENLPPVPDEPHGFPFSDLSSRFMVVPQAVVFGGEKTPLLDSWKNVCRLFDEQAFYGQARRKDGQAAKKAQALTAKSASARERAAALYAFVRDEVLSLESGSVFLDRESTADRTLEAGRGTSAEKAILLHAMLAALKVDSRLVWVTDRREGMADLSVANPYWFDRVIVRADVDGEHVYLDPYDRGLAFGRLSPYYESTEALLFDKKKPEVVTLPRQPFDHNLRRVVLDLTLDDEGRLTGKGSLRMAGHSARPRLRWKDDAEATAEAWQEWLERNFSRFEVGEVAVEEAVDEQELRVDWTLAQREEDVLGDETSLRASRPLGPVSQPFTLPPESRFTPVWFAYGDRDEVEVTVRWPEGWELDVVPSAASFDHEVGAFAAAAEVDEASRRLTFRRRFDVHDSVFGGRDKYAALRQLFGEAEKSDAQELVWVRR
jgi:hypothetical protein